MGPVHAHNGGALAHPQQLQVKQYARYKRSLNLPYKSTTYSVSCTLRKKRTTRFGQKAFLQQVP